MSLCGRIMSLNVFLGRCIEIQGIASNLRTGMDYVNRYFVETSTGDLLLVNSVTRAKFKHKFSATRAA